MNLAQRAGYVLRYERCLGSSMTPIMFDRRERRRWPLGALAAAASGGDVQQAPGEAPQSGGDSRNAQNAQPLSGRNPE